MENQNLKWKRIAEEFNHYPATMSSFYHALCECIVKADLDNTERLRRGFPELVSIFSGEKK